MTGISAGGLPPFPPVEYDCDLDIRPDLWWLRLGQWTALGVITSLDRSPRPLFDPPRNEFTEPLTYRRAQPYHGAPVTFEFRGAHRTLIEFAAVAELDEQLTLLWCERDTYTALNRAHLDAPLMIDALDSHREYERRNPNPDSDPRRNVVRSSAVAARMSVRFSLE